MEAVEVFYLAVSVAGLAACLRPVSPALLLALLILRDDFLAAALVEELEFGVLEREAPLIEGGLIVADIDSSSSRRGSLSRMGEGGEGLALRRGCTPVYSTSFGGRCCSRERWRDEEEEML